MPNVRLLVVDDNPDHADLMARVLSGQISNARVDQASAGEEAFEQLTSQRYDLAVVDICLPDSDGLRLLRRLREQGCRVPVVAVTGHGSERLAVKAMKAGAGDYLPKSRDFFVTLPHVVRRLLETEALSTQLEDWERKYAELLDLASDAVFLVDTKGRLSGVNSAAEFLCGKSREELIGLRFTEILAESTRQLVLRAVAGKRRKTVRLNQLEAELLRSDGQTVPVEVSAWPILRQGRTAGFQAVVRDVTQRRGALDRERDLVRQLEETVEKLEQKTQELEESQRLQTQFISNVSHEFRTPLNGILGYAELLRDGLYGDLTAEQKDALENISSCGHHLLDLVGEILDLSKIQAQQLKLILEPCVPSEVLDTVVSTIRPMVEEKGLQLRIGTRRTHPLILCDIQRIYQVLLNLTGNALKFTETGYIEIGTQLRNGFVQFYVRDTGLGIPRERIGDVFKEFVQLDGTMSRKHSGLGIGLSLSRRLVELHGGEIGVESQEGEGSRFYFTVPVYSPHLGGGGNGGNGEALPLIEEARTGRA